MNVGLGSGGSGPRAGNGQWDGVVKMRGLPYESGIPEVEQFFSGLTWAKNGITVPINERGNCAGEAYIQFDTYTSANSALERNNQAIGGRYIELFKSSNNDRRKAEIATAQIKAANGGGQQQQQQQQQPSSWGGLNLGGGGGPMKNNMQGGRPTPYNVPQSNGFNGAPQNNFGNTGNFGGPPAGAFGQAPANSFQPPNMQNTPNGAGGQPPIQPPPVAKAPTNGCPFPHIVGLNGLPAGSSNQEIQEFFRPWKAVAVNNHQNGYCDIAFKTHDDASAAMARNGQMIKDVAVNLELKSTPPVVETKPEPTGWATTNY